MIMNTPIINKIFDLKAKAHSSIQLRLVNKRGKNNGVFGRIVVINPRKLTIGSNCVFNHGCYINAFNNISIGDDVTISAGAKIISTGIDVDSWLSGNKKHIDNSEIVIGNHCWIGANAIILPGVKILGEFVVIAAGAVVTKSIDSGNCIYGGCPAKKIKEI